MEKYVILGGYGEMGQIIVRDLLETTKDEIWVVGHDAKKARKFVRYFKSPRVKWAAIDVTRVTKLAGFLKKIAGFSAGSPKLQSKDQAPGAICINSTQYYFNLHVMKACLKARIPYIDLGGLFYITKKQLKLHKLFKKNGLTAVVGCGATPGITNVMAAYGSSMLDRVHEIRITFGGKDYMKYKQPFVLPYSAQTILDEFSMKAAKLVHGKIKMIQPFTDEKREKFPKPVGKTNCGSILHSELATFPISFKSKGLKECSFKAGFDDNFTGLFKLLVKLGFGKEPYRALAVQFLNSFLPEKNVQVNDLEILRVTLIGTKRGAKQHQKKEVMQKMIKVIVDCRAKSIPRWNSAAGTVDTAVPPSIIAKMIASGLIKKPGVYPPEACVPPKPFFRELKKRGMNITAKTAPRLA